MPDKKTMAAFCCDLVQKHFNKQPFVGPFELKQFKPKDDALLADFFSQHTNIPCDPERPNHPCLLLHGLEDPHRKKTNVYQFIEANKDHCIGLYGTSGAGKTRCAFEYLSHNLGLYFVASTQNDAGSGDLERLLMCFKTIHARNSVENRWGGLDKNLKSKENYETMSHYVRIMVYVRNLVFNAINEQLTTNNLPALTPYQWLLIQLYPEQALNKDVFCDVVAASIQKLEQDNNGDNSVAIAMVAGQPSWSALVVDETQELLHKLTDFFLSSEDSSSLRSAFSAVLKGLEEVSFASSTGHPVFSGTGMSIEDFKEQARSIMMKRPNREDRELPDFVFQDFKPLGPAEVEQYLSSILQIQSTNIDRGVIQHISKWLRGRPRWAASFLEVYLFRKKKDTFQGTHGIFSASSAKLIEALDRYLASYTTDPTAPAPRRGSHTPKKGSPYKAIEKAVMQHKNRGVRKSVDNAVFKYAVGGNAAILTGDTNRLIEVGVAALRVYESGSCAVLDEPIMAQAGINYFSLGAATLENLAEQELGGQGEAFEKLMLPAIQDHLPRLLQAQQEASEYEVLSKFRVSARSAYGVLAIDCKTDISATIKWIEDAASASFEGQVAPFCYPDNFMGPDLLFLMWNQGHTEFVGCLSQAKYRKDINLTGALRTIMPSLLYHENRGKKDECLTGMLQGDLKTRWEKVKPKLIGSTYGCVRLMVQYPCHKKETAVPGIVEDDDCSAPKPGTAPKAGTKRKHGWLSTISKDNAAVFFDRNGLDVLNILKQNET